MLSRINTVGIFSIIGVMAGLSFLLAGTSADSQQIMAGEKTSNRVDHESTTGIESKGTEDSNMTELATFGAGCFWGVEATFRKLEGVTSTRVGYIGGEYVDPSYQQVCTGRSGHAEAVEVEYDKSIVSYEKLLDVFWSSHDPTTLNRQGPDAGTQYRSAIFYHNDEQMKAAHDSRVNLTNSEQHRSSIVTTIEPAPIFYIAEDYHQQYLEKRGLSSCSIGLKK